MTTKELTDKIATLQRKRKTAPSSMKKAIDKKLAELKGSLKKVKPISSAVQSLKTSKTKIKAMPQSSFDRLIAKLKKQAEYSFLKGMTKKEIKDDLRVVGKPVGWRIVGKNNYNVPSAQYRKRYPNRVYYENRINRSDVIQTNRLAMGGTLENESTWTYSIGNL